MLLFFYKDFKTTAKIYGVVLAFGLLCIIFDKITGPEDSVPEKGFLKFGISSEHCQHGTINDSQLTGYKSDICRYIGIITGKKIKFRGTTWKEFIPLLKNGSIHAAIIDTKNPINILDPSISEIAKLDLDEKNTLLLSPFYEETIIQIMVALKLPEASKFLKKLKD